MAILDCNAAWQHDRGASAERLTELFEADAERRQAAVARCRRDPFRLVEDPSRRGAARRIRRAGLRDRLSRRARCLVRGRDRQLDRGSRLRPMSPSAGRASPTTIASPPSATRGCAAWSTRSRAARSARSIRSCTSASAARRWGPTWCIDALGRDADRYRGAACCPISTARRSTRRPGARSGLDPGRRASARPSPPPRR